MILWIHDPASSSNWLADIFAIRVFCNLGVDSRRDGRLCRTKSVDQVDFAPCVALQLRHCFTGKDHGFNIGNHGRLQKTDHRRSEGHIVSVQIVDGSCQIVQARFLARHADGRPVHQRGQDLRKAGIESMCCKLKDSTVRIDPQRCAMSMSARAKRAMFNQCALEHVNKTGTLYGYYSGLLTLGFPVEPEVKMT